MCLDSWQPCLHIVILVLLDDKSTLLLCLIILPGNWPRSLILFYYSIFHQPPPPPFKIEQQSIQYSVTLLTRVCEVSRCIQWIMASKLGYKLVHALSGQVKCTIVLWSQVLSLYSRQPFASLLRSVRQALLSPYGPSPIPRHRVACTIIVFTLVYCKSLTEVWLGLVGTMRNEGLHLGKMFGSAKLYMSFVGACYLCPKHLFQVCSSPLCLTQPLKGISFYCGTEQWHTH